MARQTIVFVEHEGPSPYAGRMTDEHTDTGPKESGGGRCEHRGDRRGLPGVWHYDSLKLPGTLPLPKSPTESCFPTEQLAFLAAASIYSKAFLEALAKRHADAIADLVHTRFHRHGKNTEAEIGVADGSAATIAITADLPDEARLALLDLDVTADELRGKVLRWDNSASAWRPADDK